jgi:hypothetical protein
MSPTQRTQAFLRSHGFEVANCERKVPCTPSGYKGRLVTQDLFGLIDTMAIHPKEWADLLAIQTTNAGNHGNHRRKILESPLAPILARHVRIELWSWRKGGPRGKRKLWMLRRERFALTGAAGNFTSYQVEDDEI